MNALQIIKATHTANKLYDQMSTGFPTDWLRLEVGEDVSTFTHKFSGEVVEVESDYFSVMKELGKSLNIGNADKIPYLFSADNVQQFSINNDITIAKVDGKIIIREKMEDVDFPITFDFTTESLKEAISK